MRLVGICAGLALLLACAGLAWKFARTPESDSIDQEVVLDEDKQKQIWDAEHFTFEIETKFGRPFVKSLARRDSESLKHYFTSEFEGHVFQKLEGTTRRQSVVTEVHYPVESVPSRTVDAQELIEFLLSLTSDFVDVERQRLRVLKIDSLDDAAGRWRVELLWTQHGTGADGQLLALESHHHAELKFRTDEDVAVGQIVTGWEIDSAVVRSAPAKLMEEVTTQVGLDTLPLEDNWDEFVKLDPYRYQVAVEDFDRDGYPDIAVASRKRAWLLRSESGQKFVDVTATLLPSSVKHVSPPHYGLPAWIDYDNDGFPDLLLGRSLFHNNEGKGFDDVSAGSGLDLLPMPMGCAVADYDADGLLDLYIVYQDDVIRMQSEGPSKKPLPWVGDNDSGCRNQLWHNEGNGRFRDVTTEAGAGGGARHTFAAVWFHFDDDHWPDLYLANDFGNNVLLRNQGDGTFEDVSTKTGVADFATSMGAVAGDLNNDGTPEIYVANMYSKMGRRIIAKVNEADYPAGIFPQIQGSCAGNRLYQWSPDDAQFHESGTHLGVNEVGWAYGPAMVDFDGDGFLDLYATTGYLSFDRDEPDG